MEPETHFSSINELGGFEMELNQAVLGTIFPMLMSEGRTTHLLFSYFL